MDATTQKDHLAGSNGARGDESALQIQFNVIRALFLRDVRTRFFGSGLGYLIALAWPLAHILLLLMIYWASGRVAPYGDSAIQFFAVSLCPVVSFMYMSRWIAFATSANKPLLHFPRVKFLDIVIARAMLETANAGGVVIVVLSTLAAFDIPFIPYDIPMALKGMFLALLIGLGLGTLSAVITLALPMWAVAYSLFTIVIYATSGVLFVPDWLPSTLRNIVAWNPVLHSVEMVRLGYYSSYRSSVLDAKYAIDVGIGSLLVGLVIERSFRRQLSNGI